MGNSDASPARDNEIVDAAVEEADLAEIAGGTNGDDWSGIKPGATAPVYAPKP
ncbi:hypothetical protein ACIP98_40960 [Streptomyces sp. NPDC088354]|uniref:hypothetical protein n=1 Tax=Streptomyces sp. NPDC088354 TaxID=3365856 RepID=UPI003811D10A